jgi:purine-binding chemotaxis protein CheW
VGKLSDVIGAVEKVTNEEVSLGYTVAVVDAGKVKIYMKNLLLREFNLSSPMNEELDFGDEFEELEKTYLTFYSSGKSFGIKIKNVVQIISYQPINKIPEFPAYALGVISLRGEVIPVIDLNMRFGDEPKEYNDRTCIIVTRIIDGTVGFVVESVDEVIKIEKEEISDPPKVIGSIPEAYLDGIGRKNGKKSLLLSIEKVIIEDDINVMTKEVEQWK